MIPLRVRLKGFLCYKDEQEISFDGSSLWMLAGLNGSGKSAVFDAVTYAIFGHHRAGSQHADELINKGSDTLAVEFDFLQEGQAYRVRRTLKRSARGSPKATQQVYRRVSANGNGQGDWGAVEGTGRKAEFDAWVSDNIGLSYETFTSSVLLLQGKAEKLLDSTAKGRFEVLAGIVDLERYERLHRKADDRRRVQEAAVKSVQTRLSVLPEVSAIELVEAEGRIAAAESVREQARQEIERLQGLEFQARQWVELQARLTQARQRWLEAQRVLGDAAGIERDVARLHELGRVLPHLQVVIEQRGQIQESERKSADGLKQKLRLEGDLAQRDAALQQARQKRTALQNSIAEDERRHKQVVADFRKAAALLEKLKEHERQENDLGRVQKELSALPADPSADLRKLRERVEQLAAVDQAVPLLARLQTQREEVRLARAREKEAVAKRQAVEARGKQCAADVEKFRPQLAEAAQARQQADQEATRTSTLLDQAQQGLDELMQLRGAQVCRHCGQALTAGHLREEKGRREKEVAAAADYFKQAAAAQQAAQAGEKQARDQLARLEKLLAEAREEYGELRHQAGQAHKDLERLQGECGQTHAMLAEPFRGRVCAAAPADWLETTFPDADDLAKLRKEAAGLAEARRQLRDADEVLQKWGRLKAQEGTVRQTLERLRSELPGDRGGLRRDHARLEADEQSLEKGLAARRAEHADTQKELDRLTREREQVQQQLTVVLGQVQNQEAARQHFRQALARALRELPAEWQAPAERAGLADVESLAQERARLVAANAEERGRQLQQARLGVEVLRQEQATLEAQAEEFPAEARQDPARVQALLQEAKQVQRGRDEELSQARQHHHHLEGQRRQRQELQEECLKLERELADSRLLAELLGRDRLQLHLVRQAERQVVDHANAVLDRLSGGELYLRLCGEAGGEGNSAKALELEAHNRTTGETPINVAFLSGSQKFRVAVSLALGIGQYASRQHRPLESVIIDEGFGCLDRNGRQVMIQELQNLRSQMRCILLVSHQEEFADAFADGYRFELQGGTTVATRFQR